MTLTFFSLLSSALRTTLRVLLGKRSAVTGSLTVEGIASSITIRRTQYGIPLIDANNDKDAWFGLGFCHAQDRAAQIEFFKRAASGTLSEIIGEKGITIDKLSRRIGFRRAAEAQLSFLSFKAKETLDAYSVGVSEGLKKGNSKLPHEFVLLRTTPSPWEAVDVLSFIKLQSFLLPSNWDVELARLKILSEDGPKALYSLDPVTSSSGPVVDPQVREKASRALERLTQDISLLLKVIPAGSGSNNWVIDETKTTTGRPLLANDPHLNPMIPPPWYFARVQTPEWSVAGASIPGTPCFPAGHNGVIAWGSTAGLHDTVDLFIEEIDIEHALVREQEEMISCKVLDEQIKVKGKEPLHEKILVTPRGPIVSPAFDDVPFALSMKALWLEPLPVRGFLEVYRAKNFEEFRQAFEQWPLMGQYLVYADTAGEIGWQLVGQTPRRKDHWGMVPHKGSEVGVGWGDFISFEEMPWGKNPQQGFFATANNPPTSEGKGPYLGYDWVSGYRASAIIDALKSHNQWSVKACQSLQLSRYSKPWEEVKEVVLSSSVTDSSARRALDLLSSWDGTVNGESAAAALYVYFFCEFAQHIAKSKAPKSWEWALGKGFGGLVPHTLFADRRFEHVVYLLKTQPKDWFSQDWNTVINNVLGAAVKKLETDAKLPIEKIQWGKLRSFTLKHLIFGEVPLLRHCFNIGPLFGGGDANTVFQATVNPLNPKGEPSNIPNMRMVIDVGEWSNSRFSLCGGQSGNIASSNYADLLSFWEKGEGVPIPWTEQEKKEQTVEMLTLLPSYHREP